jgi:predicted small metal-binding protein
MPEAKRKVMDCRLYPSDKGCTLSIEGTEDEVLEAATDHAITVHGHTNSPELREQIRSIMKDAEQ